jgi:hypothetical protein
MVVLVDMGKTGLKGVSGEGRTWDQSSRGRRDSRSSERFRVRFDSQAKQTTKIPARQRLTRRVSAKTFMKAVYLQRRAGKGLLGSALFAGTCAPPAVLCPEW